VLSLANVYKVSGEWPTACIGKLAGKDWGQPPTEQGEISYEILMDRIEAGLYLVKSHGIYLMSNGDPGFPSPDRPRRDRRRGVGRELLSPLGS
jgi:hypothetical protein